MIESEVAEFLGFMAAFDRREVSQLYVEAWASLPMIQQISLPLAKRAVILYRDAGPDERGNKPYLDDVELRRWVRAAKEEIATNERRARALRYSRGQQTVLDEYADTNTPRKVIMELEGLTEAQMQAMESKQLEIES